LQDKEYIEEEMDLRELFRIIWSKRLFIVIFTAIITFMALLYVFIKTPVYEVKSVVRIGYIGTSLVEDSNIIEKKLRLIFNVDNKQTITKEKAIVSNISAVKKVDNFLEISTQAFSNKKALEKNKEVVSFLQNEYKYKIDEYILKTNLDIKNLEEEKKYIQNVTKKEKQEKINSLLNIDLVSIENKLKFNKEKLIQYQSNINEILKRKKISDTQNMLSAMEMLNYQSLILNIQNEIENLTKEKQNLLNTIIPNLKRSLEFDIKDKLSRVEDKINLVKLNLSNKKANNSEIVGDILVDDNPIKPKKVLIIVVAFVTGFILAIFIVFLMQFISGFRKEK
jgi:uncharacterized protein involved in exopolysaccharide biosynthesis